MKIGIIISGNSYKSHLNYYLSFLDNQKIQYDVICWNRRMMDESENLSYNVSQNEDKGYFCRFYSYLKYKKFVIDCLDRNKYDKVIISTIAIAVLLYPYLKKHYKEKYIFDIRDYSLILKFTWFILKRLIDSSVATVISSEGFKQWLPKSSKYYIAHNFPYDLTNENVKFRLEKLFVKENKESFLITSIGAIRDFEANKFIIDNLKNSDEYKLNFIGTGHAYNRLKSYVIDKKVANVSFHGFYQKKDEADLLKETDFINIYTNFDMNSRTLITNRFYLSTVLGIPMIVRSGTYQAELCEMYKLGCVLYSHVEIKAQMKDFIVSFDHIEYTRRCRFFLNIVENDTKRLESLLLDFVFKH
jgi:hypothetical protein